MISRKIKHLILIACPGLEREVLREFERFEENAYPAKIVVMGYIDRNDGKIPRHVTERARIALRSLKDGYELFIKHNFPQIDFDSLMAKEEMKRRAQNKPASKR